MSAPAHYARDPGTFLDRHPLHSSVAPRIVLRLLRLAFSLVVAVIVVFLALLVAVRYVVFPNLDPYRDTIAARLSQELGQPVAIGGIEGSWDGWNPRLTLTDVALRDAAAPNAAALLSLPKVQFVVAWTSLAVRDIRLRSLTIERPELTVRRDVGGRFHIGGIEVDVDAPTADLTFVEWLAHQREIVVRDARVVWEDELRGAPPLTLEHVRFKLEQSRVGVRFGLVGSPPPDVAAPVDLRGELVAGSLRDWSTARGRFYLRLDYADVARWRDWVPVLRPVDAGDGALRVWVDFTEGVTTAVVADLELTGVRGHVTPKLPQLDLDYLRGRITWQHTPGRRDITLHDLTFRTRTGEALVPVTMTIVAQESAEGRITGGTLAFDRIDTKPLSELAVHLPLPEQVRSDLVALDLRGSVTQGRFAWTGTPDEPSSFSGTGDFAQLGIAANNALPGAEGVSGRFTFDEMRGELTLDSRDVRVRLPQVFADALVFTTASGTVRWVRAPDEVKVILDDVKFATAHTSGSASGSWRSQPQGPGLIDLRAQLARGDAQALYRYLPLTLSAELRDWLKASIKSGRASDARMVLVGNLADFPFASAKQGQFLVTFKVAGATIDYADGWPPITGVDGDVKFEGPGMAIEAHRGLLQGATVGPMTMNIPDLDVEHPVLTVRGKAEGPTAAFLDFIAASPVDAWIDHSTRGITASGNGRLDLSFTLPLGTAQATAVAGDFEFMGNEVDIPGVPTLADVVGHLDFSDHAMQARDLSAALFGGEAKIGLVAADGTLRVTAEGTADAAALRRDFDSAFMERVSGSAPWRLTASVRDGVPAWTVTSDLVGVAIAAPSPVGKAAAERATLRVDRRDRSGKGVEDTLVVDYRSNLRLVAQRRLGPHGAEVERALVALGPGAARESTAPQPGLWIRGTIDDLDLDEWIAVMARTTASAGAVPGAPAAPEEGLRLSGVELAARRLDVFGRALHDVTLAATRAGDDWRIRTKGREAEGTATWQAAAPTRPNGRIVARLARLVPPGPAELHPLHSESADATKPRTAWPELDVVADSFFLRGHDTGRLELRAQPAGGDWRIDKLALVSAEGRIDATGGWRVTREPPLTDLALTLATENAGAFLARFGYPVAVRNTPTKISGELRWAGGPNDFDYPTLAGRLTLATGAGQFTKIDPGIGKLLGVLSLQELPRRITLDFRDVFSEGFAFDRIEGDFAIERGLMTTDNLTLWGPAAQVALRGDIDLAAETQKLTVRVKPALSTMFSAGAAVLFLANPVVGAAVGAGTLLAQKLFDNPLDQIFSYEYLVTGPWVDPRVEQVSRTPMTMPGAPAAPGDNAGSPDVSSTSPRTAGAPATDATPDARSPAVAPQ